MTRDELLGRKNPPHTFVVQGETVYLRVMSAREVTDYEMTLKENVASTRERLLVRCLCDENGVPLFTDADLEAVGRLPYPFAEPIVDEISKLHWPKPKPADDVRKN